MTDLIRLWATDQTHGLEGIGKVFTKGEGYGVAAIDFDKCMDQHGDLESWAAEIIARFPSTFMELSPSGNGCHVWCLGSPKDKLKYKKRWAKPDTAKGEGIDSLDRSHNCFLTVTGVPPEGMDLIPDVIDCQPALDMFRDNYLVKTPRVRTSPRAASQPSKTLADPTGGDTKPWDDFDARAPWDDALPVGWFETCQTDEYTRYSRPGKSTDCAVVYHASGDVLF